MSKIFISYRRQDTLPIAGRIFDRLEAKFGGEDVFMDIDSMPVGVDFHRWLDGEVSRTAVVLALIGPGWIEARDEAGKRRLDNPDDFVRIEIEAALRRDIPLVPVLIGGAPMPKAGELPETLKLLARRNAAVVDIARDFHVHMDRLIGWLEWHLNEQTSTVVSTQSVSPVTRPNWASTMGHDRNGQWTEFTVGEVTQRMRWIEPGRFIMGSPEGEPGRYGADEDGGEFNEGPQHEVRISKGFWLFDTPVTQALWTEVMGDNPSYFEDPKRPVEQVSWDDVSQFLQKINARVPDLDLALPTEAQWEYACRAGTDTATYAGPIDILGENNAPVLDAIAWYGGNSGVGFELKNGYDSSDWDEKQYDHKSAGTHPVGLKLPNAWGLYDMLGNVWEWCADDLRQYEAGAVTDPVGSLDSARRALRGGSWYDFARDVRAASRDADARDYRYYDVGFRCARVLP